MSAKNGCPSTGLILAGNHSSNTCNKKISGPANNGPGGGGGEDVTSDEVRVFTEEGTEETEKRDSERGLDEEKTSLLVNISECGGASSGPPNNRNGHLTEKNRSPSDPNRRECQQLVGNLVGRLGHSYHQPPSQQPQQGTSSNLHADVTNDVHNLGKYFDPASLYGGSAAAAADAFRYFMPPYSPNGYPMGFRPTNSLAQFMLYNQEHFGNPNPAAPMALPTMSIDPKSGMPRISPYPFPSPHQYSPHHQALYPHSDFRQGNWYQHHPISSAINPHIPIPPYSPGHPFSPNFAKYSSQILSPLTPSSPYGNAISPAFLPPKSDLFYAPHLDFKNIGLSASGNTKSFVPPSPFSSGLLNGYTSTDHANFLAAAGLTPPPPLFGANIHKPGMNELPKFVVNGPPSANQFTKHLSSQGTSGNVRYNVEVNVPGYGGNDFSGACTTGSSNANKNSHNKLKEDAPGRSGIVDAIPSAGSHKAKKKKHKLNSGTSNNPNGGPHIKKPLNAFMLFMKDQRSKVMEECTLKESSAINQLLGRMWHSLSREEQSKYYEMARKERQIHMQLYPGWSARDNYHANQQQQQLQNTSQSNMCINPSSHNINQSNSTNHVTKHNNEDDSQSCAQQSNHIVASGDPALANVLKKRKKKRERPVDPCDTELSASKKCRARYGIEQQSNWCKPCRRKKKCIKFIEDTSDTKSSKTLTTTLSSIQQTYTAKSLGHQLSSSLSKFNHQPSTESITSTAGRTSINKNNNTFSSRTVPHSKKGEIPPSFSSDPDSDNISSIDGNSNNQLSTHQIHGKYLMHSDQHNHNHPAAVDHKIGNFSKSEKRLKTLDPKTSCSGERKKVLGTRKQHRKSSHSNAITNPSMYAAAASATAELMAAASPFSPLYQPYFLAMLGAAAVVNSPLMPNLPSPFNAPPQPHPSSNYVREGAPTVSHNDTAVVDEDCKSGEESSEIDNDIHCPWDTNHLPKRVLGNDDTTHDIDGDIKIHTYKDTIDVNESKLTADLIPDDVKEYDDNKTWNNNDGGSPLSPLSVSTLNSLDGHQNNSDEEPTMSREKPSAANIEKEMDEGRDEHVLPGSSKVKNSLSAGNAVKKNQRGCNVVPPKNFKAESQPFIENNPYNMPPPPLYPGPNPFWNSAAMYPPFQSPNSFKNYNFCWNQANNFNVPCPSHNSGLGSDPSCLSSSCTSCKAHNKKNKSRHHSQQQCSMAKDTNSPKSSSPSKHSEDAQEAAGKACNKKLTKNSSSTHGSLFSHHPISPYNNVPGPSPLSPFAAAAAAELYFYNYWRAVSSAFSSPHSLPNAPVGANYYGTNYYNHAETANPTKGKVASSTKNIDTIVSKIGIGKSSQPEFRTPKVPSSTSNAATKHKSKHMFRNVNVTSGTGCEIYEYHEDVSEIHNFSNPKVGASKLSFSENNHQNLLHNYKMKAVSSIASECNRQISCSRKAPINPDPIDTSTSYHEQSIDKILTENSPNKPTRTMNSNVLARADCGDILVNSPLQHTPPDSTSTENMAGLGICQSANSLNIITQEEFTPSTTFIVTSTHGRFVASPRSYVKNHCTDRKGPGRSSIDEDDLHTYTFEGAPPGSGDEERGDELGDMMMVEMMNDHEVPPTCPNNLILNGRKEDANLYSQTNGLPVDTNSAKADSIRKDFTKTKTLNNYPAISESGKKRKSFNQLEISSHKRNTKINISDDFQPLVSPTKEQPHCDVLNKMYGDMDTKTLCDSNNDITIDNSHKSVVHNICDTPNYNGESIDMDETTSDTHHIISPKLYDSIKYGSHLSNIHSSPIKQK